MNELSMTLICYIYLFNHNLFDFIDKTVAQIDLSTKRKAILQTKFANI